jgi:CheY-like chemotaxis protein
MPQTVTPPPSGASPDHLDASSLPPLLVVDDDAEARRIFLRFFSKMKLANPVEFAADGEAALTYLADVEAGRAAEPVLVLLDMRMPKKSGLDVLRFVRGTDVLAHLPVVMLTGSAEMDEVSECYELGVESYLVKPVGFAALNDVLLGLELRRAFLPASR